MTTRTAALSVAGLGIVALVVTVPSAATAGPQTARSVVAHPTAAPAPVKALPKVARMVGGGGAVSSVDRDASQVGIDVLRAGGNAADAAVATAAALGVTEPFSSGIGGGGFFVYYDAKRKRVSTIDGRETAPRTFTPTVFTNPDGTARNFSDVVTSGLSVGTPGTLATWDEALNTFGTISLSSAMKPGQTLARNGFVADATFVGQIEDNAARFARFPATAALYLPGGQPPGVGSTFKNPGMAKAYAEIRAQGVDALYEGALGRAMVKEAQRPHTVPGVSVLPGQLTMADLRAYRALHKAPVASTYRGLDVYGMPVPSSGGIAVAEILNLLEAYDARTGRPLSGVDEVQYLHRFSEASATAFADRNRYVGDVPGVPVAQLTSKAFAKQRACIFSATSAQPRPIAFGTPDGSYPGCDTKGARLPQPREGTSTTNLETADRWGNVASYTFTIEQIGGSGITVPGYGTLLNNELTDFDFVPLQPGVPDPNLPGPGKRPRSSMSPTVILKDGRPWLGVGSPGGATIITTVAQVITEYVDRDLPLLQAIAAPRLSSRNGTESAEPAIYDTDLGARLQAMGHNLSTTPYIGAATAIRVMPQYFVAAAEPVRRGGGSAMVVAPRAGKDLTGRTGR